ncbi:YhcN/YlaJ family sporulation lipoprotein [Alkalihalobacillus hemicellulosilyticus]|uniref:Lipoprotein n=1 Tax=Halalkalibacter hemicellulosilyticusJCM 9152 TaxID=1236971 RepID=W4QBB8_9BACI|nr:YhcN/YlaJ family sporulation lipoprotein [Halalkalibacter hemicellulosilyticus]GAE28948.1 hypothetical protein JCM9152_286 [Halalkalibacter hemicellulosilyticusJCM 9152]
MKKVIWVLLVCCFYLIGCQVNTNEEIKSLQLKDVIVEQNMANTAKEIVLSMDEVTEVKGVSHGNCVYITPHVKPLDRFFLKEIRKKSHDAIKKRYPDATVHVSTDEKIFIEIGKLEQQLKQHSISEERLSKRLKELDEMMKG